MRYQLNDRSPQCADDCFIAPGAQVIGDVELHEKSSVWFNAVIRGDMDKICIGEASNIQDVRPRYTITHWQRGNGRT